IRPLESRATPAGLPKSSMTFLSLTPASLSAQLRFRIGSIERLFSKASMNRTLGLSGGIGQTSVLGSIFGSSCFFFEAETAGGRSERTAAAVMAQVGLRPWML